MLNGKFDCCKKAVCEREASFPQWQLPDGTKSLVCPAKLVDTQSLTLIQLHRHYLNGILPLAGGLLDQSNFYIESMTYIDGIA